jgi:hypothetical protein
MIEDLTTERLRQYHETVNGTHNPVHYLSIDPGKANGVCGYDAKFYPVFMATIKAVDLLVFLKQFEQLQKLIMEGYRVYPGKEKAHIYDDLETPRVIGRVEAYCETHDVPLVMQAATIKATGYAWIGEKALPKSNPLNHEMDAHVHFMYWAVKNGKIPAKRLLEKEKK